MYKTNRKNSFSKLIAITLCLCLVSGVLAFLPISASAESPVISLNKPVTLVDSSGAAIAAADIPGEHPAAHLVDGNYFDTYGQTVTTLFGAIINLEAPADIDCIELMNFSANWVTSFDIKASLDGQNWDTIRTDITAGESELVTAEFSPAVHYQYIWVKPSSFSAESWRCIAEISVRGILYDPNQVISQGSNATLVNQDGTPVDPSDIASPAANIVDGNNGTYAQTVSSLFGAVIDLGGNANIASVTVKNFWANYITNYDIKASTNGTDWTTLAAGISITDSQEIYNAFSNVTARYIWVRPNSYAADSWRTIAEITVRGQIIGEQNVDISAGKYAKLVNENGVDVPLIDISFPASNLTNGNKSDVAQGKSGVIGAVIDLEGIARVATVEVTNFWANYVTLLDIKGSLDGVNYTTLASGIAMTSQESHLITLPQEYIGRFIWIAPTEFSSPDWRCISEVTVKGSMKVSFTGFTLPSAWANVLSGLTLGTVKEDAMNSTVALADGYTFDIVKADGSAMAGTSPIISGDKMVLSKDGSPLCTYEFSVTGDIDKSGDVSALDVIALKNLLLGKNPLSAAQTFAGDVVTDNKVDIVDLLTLKDSVLSTLA